MTSKGLVAFVGCASVLWAQAATERGVLNGTRLGSGFDMGVNTSDGRTDWVSQAEDAMKIAYPAGQEWGAVFITVGKPKARPRPSVDLSGFNFLLVEMRGDQKGEVSVGIKDNKQLDDGTEQKVVVPLTSEYQPYVIPLKRFRGTDLRSIYVAAEVVFDSPHASTVWVRSIKYLAKADGTTGLLLK